MKKIILLFIITLPLLVNAQAHLGATLDEIRKMHPDNYFKINYTTDGTKYDSSDMDLGNYSYYFNSNGLSYMCIQIPSNMQNLNTQVEIYNKKYVVVSKTSWRAYLDGGGMMNINLTYESEYKVYVFYYTAVE